MQAPLAVVIRLLKLLLRTSENGIISREEENALLAACGAPKRKLKHLRAIIVCALETGLRQGEIFKICWSDIDFDEVMGTAKLFRPATAPQPGTAISYYLRSEPSGEAKITTIKESEP